MRAEGTAWLELKFLQSPIRRNENDEARQLRNSEDVYDGVIRRPLRDGSWQHGSENILSLNGVRCGLIKRHPRVLDPQGDCVEGVHVVKQWAKDHRSYTPSAETTKLVHDIEEQIALDLYLLLTGNQAKHDIGISEIVNLGIHKTFLQWLDMDIVDGAANVIPSVFRLHDFLWKVLKWWTMASVVRETAAFPAMVPITAEDGDIAVVLFGCKLPLILRARAGKDNQYELIGAMHCLAIMNGEMLEEFERGECSKETFHLV